MNRIGRRPGASMLWQFRVTALLVTALAMPCRAGGSDAAGGADPGDISGLYESSKVRFQNIADKPNWSDEERSRRVAELRKKLPALHAKFNTILEKAKADLPPDPNEDDIHKFNWTIASDTAHGELAKVYVAMRDYYCYFDERGKGKHYTPEFWALGMEGYHWFEKNVYLNQIVRKAPPARLDQSYLKKDRIRILFSGDSITGYMNPGDTARDYFDSRFEILGNGLAGHMIGTYFSSTGSRFARRWDADIIVVMLGTNGTPSAANDGAKGRRGNRDELQAEFVKNLRSFRDLPFKPQIIIASVPPVGAGTWFYGCPAMREMQMHVAYIHHYPWIDMYAALQPAFSRGLLTIAPGNLGGNWSPSTDDAHTSTGPAMATYYGLVARQVLEPTKWYDLKLRCSASDDAAWKEPWLLAQATRAKAADPTKGAAGLKATEGQNGEFTFQPLDVGPPGMKANGEVAFLEPKTGGTFYIMAGRAHSFTFGRPYMNTPDKNITDRKAPAGTFPAQYALTGTLTRGDGKPAVGAAVELADKKTQTDAHGSFTFSELSGDITKLILKCAPLE